MTHTFPIPAVPMADQPTRKRKAKSPSTPVDKATAEALLWLFTMEASK
jgi:hypothetical protein